MKKIHVGFLMSYDYEKLKNSIPPVYEKADKIFIACDINFNTWTGNKFSVSESFFQWIKEIDVNNKIEFYFDNFFIDNLSPIENDTRERHLLALQMGIGNWIVQVDSDEFFIDFSKFVDYLKSKNHYLYKPEKNPIQIAGFLINIYKYLDNGLLYVNKPTKVMLATNYPNYKRARNTKQQVIYTNNLLMHECLSRNEAELNMKFSNWGHSDEVNETFFKKWKKANIENYKELKDVFYLDPKIWPSLDYFPSTSLDSIQKIIHEKVDLKITKTKLFSKNFGQWFKFLIKKKKPKFEKYF